MEFRQLEYFVAVAEEASFTRAAARLFVSQPALSRRVQQLERELDVELFHRSVSGAVLTAAGASFLVSARRMLSLAEESVRAAQGVADRNGPHLRIGYHHNFHYHLLGELLGELRVDRPDLDIRVLPMTGSELRQALAEGAVDIAFVLDGDTGAEHVASYEILAAVPRSSPLAAHTSVTLEDFHGANFVALDGDAYPGSPARVERNWDGTGGKPHVIQGVARLEDAMAFVGTGLASGLVPAQAAFSVDPGKIALRRFSPPLAFSLFITWDQNEPSSDVVAFVQAARLVRDRQPDEPFVAADVGAAG